MKKFSLLFMLLFMLSASALGIDWGNWMVVDNISGNLDQATMEVKQGKVAIVYQKTPVVGGDAKLLYTEYIYSTKCGIVQTIQDEPVPNAVATWGTNVCGVAMDRWNQTYIAVLPNISEAPARVLKRLTPENYILDEAYDSSTIAYTSLGITHESFKLDPNEDLHFVWGSNAAGTKKLVYAKRAGWKMNPSESSGWVRSTMTPTGALSVIKPSIATNTGGAKHISYLDDNGGSSIFYTSNMSSSSVAGYCGVTEASGSDHDIEVLTSTGRAMIAHMEVTSGPNMGRIALEIDTGTSWLKKSAISYTDLRNFGWFGTNPYTDIEQNGNGDMVMVLAHLDNYDLGSAAKTIIKYYTYAVNVGMWSKTEIATFDTGTNFVKGIDLEFDENGKPFILLNTKQSVSGDYEVLLLTTPFSGPAYCGDHTTSYLSGDLDKNCYVNMSDVRLMVDDWLKCTDPVLADCDDVGVTPRAEDGFPPIFERNGEPVFPIGWYGGIANQGTLEELTQNAIAYLNEIKATGADFVMPGGSASEANYMTAFLEAGLVTGIKSMFNVLPTATPGAQVNFCKNYDSLFGWYVLDEPEAFDVTPAELQGIYNDIRTYDTNHPVLVTHHSHWYGAAAYLWPVKHCDLIATDFYPIYQPEFSGVLWRAAQNAPYWSKIAGKLGYSAHFAVPQAFGGMGGWALGTYAEQRYLTYSPIVHGARGLFYFAWDGGWVSELEWIAFRDNIMTPIIGQIRQLEQAILSNSTAVTVSSSRDMDTTGHLVKDTGYLFGQDSNYGYLMAVNNTPGTLNSVQIYLEGPGLLEAVGSGNVSVPVMFESRNVTMQESSPGHWTISDTFTPYAVHVYRLYAVPAPQQCGNIASVYPVNDLNKDCYVNFSDFAALADGWLKCSDPANTNCN